MGKGELRVYLGSAPGVGKTFRMLDEGWRRRERGTDVVVAFVETHDRALTSAQLRDLEVIPRIKREYRGGQFEEMDLDAVLARHPEVALVDEFAHTNVPGGAHEKRWQDVQVLLDAGITVITTVNIQHLESLNDVVQKITGIVQQETVPDAVVRRAQQIELVDITPEALRRRMAHGNIYKPDKVDASLSNYFRSGNLTALRELALLWLADRVEDSLQRYLDDHDIADTWETRERLIVAVTGTSTDELLLRRAARIASRTGAELIAVHVAKASERDVSVDMSPTRILAAELDGRLQEIVDDDIANALVAFARSERGTQIVLGSSRPHSPLRPPSGVVENVIRRARDLDVHIIAVGGSRPARVRRRRDKRRVPWPRTLAVLALTVVALPALTIVMTQLHTGLSLSTVSLAYLTTVIVLTWWGGVVVAIVAALIASGLENFYFVKPLHTLVVARPDDVVALIAFLCFAIGASVVVGQIERRSGEAERARAEAEILATAAATAGTTRHDLLPLMDSLRAVFDLPGVSLLVRRDDEWSADVVSGNPVDSALESTRFEVDADHALVLSEARLDFQDRKLVTAFVDRLAQGLRSQGVMKDAIELRTRAEADALRTGLLRAVAQDLREPLAALEESVGSLPEPETQWLSKPERVAIESIERESARLSRVVTNLVDAGRLEAGLVIPRLVTIALGDIIAGALSPLEPGDRVVDIDLPDDLPRLKTDADMMQRIIGNVVSNAFYFSPEDREVRITAGITGGSLELLVIDQGRGIAPAQLAAFASPVRPLMNDRARIGLGLTVVIGFVKLLGGTVRFEDTPGGGLTVAIELPI